MTSSNLCCERHGVGEKYGTLASVKIGLILLRTEHRVAERHFAAAFLLALHADGVRGGSGEGGRGIVWN